VYAIRVQIPLEQPLEARNIVDPFRYKFLNDSLLPRILLTAATVVHLTLRLRRWRCAPFPSFFLPIIILTRTRELG